MLRLEQSFGGELFLAVFEQRHECASSGRPHCCRQHLIVGAACIDRQLTLGDNFQAFFGAEGESVDLTLPHDRIEDSLIVFDVGIHMARAGNGNAPKFAAHADMVEIALNGSLEAARKLGNGKLWLI